MFNGCSSLTSLDISNFVSQEGVKVDDIFSGLSKINLLCLNNVITTLVSKYGTLTNNPEVNGHNCLISHVKIYPTSVSE